MSNTLLMLRQLMEYGKCIRFVDDHAMIPPGCGQFGAIMRELTIPNLVCMLTEFETGAKRKIIAVTQVIRIERRG